LTAIVFPVGSFTRVPRGSDGFTDALACEEAGAGLDRSDVPDVSPEPHPPARETMTSDIAARIERVQISEFTTVSASVVATFSQDGDPIVPSSGGVRR